MFWKIYSHLTPARRILRRTESDLLKICLRCTTLRCLIIRYYLLIQLCTGSDVIIDIFNCTCIYLFALPSSSLLLVIGNWLLYFKFCTRITCPTKKALAISQNESIKGIKVVLSASSLKVALRDDRDIFLDHLWKLVPSPPHPQFRWCSLWLNTPRPPLTLKFFFQYYARGRGAI